MASPPAPADAQRPTAAWDPAQYLRFSDQRLRPALDLLGQVPLTAPGRVVDLGCGAGNVTAILQQRFPQAEVVGVDGSAAMLEKARVDGVLAGEEAPRLISADAGGGALQLRASETATR